MICLQSPREEGKTRMLAHLALSAPNPRPGQAVGTPGPHLEPSQMCLCRRTVGHPARCILVGEGPAPDMAVTGCPWLRPPGGESPHRPAPAARFPSPGLGPGWRRPQGRAACCLSVQLGMERCDLWLIPCGLRPGGMSCPLSIPVRIRDLGWHGEHRAWALTSGDTLTSSRRGGAGIPS